MCGIIGYVGKKQATPIILEGLRRMEYRGYDSAGLAVVTDHHLQVRKKQGGIDKGLAKLLADQPVVGAVGIGHTRWATHGKPSDENSHPHVDQTGQIAVVHNGVIENYQQLKSRFEKAGHQFQSTTDTEVLAHLIGEKFDELSKERGQFEPLDSDAPLLTRAVIKALREVSGTYGLAVLCQKYPGIIVGARCGSPLIIGVSDGEHFLASDPGAIVAHTRQAVFLNDGDVATLSAEEFSVTNLGAEISTVQIGQIEFSSVASDRGEFAHYMLKEIFEQPRTIENVMRGRLNFEEASAHLGGLNMNLDELRAVDRVLMVACGTSWHAALVGEYLFEDLAQIPAEVDYASEFRYRSSPIEKNTLVIALTQSGETADTLAAVRESKRRGHKVLAICNVVGSTIAREANGGIYLHAGPEIGVASTKAFTSQVTALVLLSMLMGRIRNLSSSRGLQIIRGLEKVPGQIQTLLDKNKEIAKIAKKYFKARNFYFLGRLMNFPVALEGALKLKEISYIHAEGFPAAEMKHGPIALIDEKSPVVVLVPNDAMYEKILSNIEVVKARGAPVIAIASEGDKRISELVEEVIHVPETLSPLFPLLGIIPLQLLAYHIADQLGCDIDKPRNLAKSVTVE